MMVDAQVLGIFTAKDSEKDGRTPIQLWIRYCHLYVVE